MALRQRGQIRRPGLEIFGGRPIPFCRLAMTDGAILLEYHRPILWVSDLRLLDGLFLSYREVGEREKQRAQRNDAISTSKTNRDHGILAFERHVTTFSWSSQTFRLAYCS
jgi:hypothetical protein